MSFYFYKNHHFPTYIENKKIERTTETSLPSSELVKIFSIWHDLSYANFQWISLIQYIGEHISQKNTHQYPVKLLQHITEISPKFHSAYEWALWILPIPQNSDLHYTDKQKEDLIPSLTIAHKGITELCNTTKIHNIIHSPLNNTLWENNTLKQPCKSGMLPYLIAFYEGQLWWNSEVAKNFYKISGMQDDAPGVSKILAILASAPKDDYKSIAMNFTLNAMGGYDQEPFSCHSLSSYVFNTLQQPINIKNIQEILQQEKQLVEPPQNETIWTQTCFDMIERGIKYTYLSFIQEEAKKFPEITQIEDLLPKIGLSEVPTTQNQKDISIRKKWDLWEYYWK